MLGKRLDCRKCRPFRDFLDYEACYEVSKGGYSKVYAFTNAASCIPEFPVDLPLATRLKVSRTPYLHQRAFEVTQELKDVPGVSVELGIYVESLQAFSIARFVPGRDIYYFVDVSSVLELVRDVKRVAQTLELAHLKGFMHGDVKPGNVLKETGEKTIRPHVIDWDFARPIPDRVQTEARYRGSPYFLPPERLIDGEWGPFLDIYGLGCVLYLALTKVDAFAGTHLRFLSRAKRNIEPVLDEITFQDPDLTQLAKRTVAKFLDPIRKKRYQTMHEGRVAIENLESAILETLK